MNTEKPSWSTDVHGNRPTGESLDQAQRVDVRILMQERALLLSKTYAHLFTAILAFVALCMLGFKLGIAQSFYEAISGIPMSWLLVLGGFALVGWFASSTAHNAKSLTTQYIALFIYVAAEALIFMPLLYVADSFAGGGVITSAAAITLLGFSGLTAIVFMTRKDFSFLGGLLRWGFTCAFLLIVTAVVFGFELGALFSVGMIALAGASVLYTTSNIIHEYPSDRYVAASLELFAAIALMFWYVLRLMIQLQSD